MNQTNSVCVNDIKMAYTHFGNGNNNLVVIPGISIKSVASQVEALKNTFKDFIDDYSIYVFDRRINPPENYTIKQIALDTVEVMRFLGIKKTSIYATSQGGMIALYIGAYHNELIDKLAIASTTHYLDEHSSNIFSIWGNIAKSGDIRKLVKTFINDVYSKQLLEQYEQFIIDSNSDVSKQELDNFIIYNNAFFTMDIGNDIDFIKCPVLVQAAKGDKIFKYERSLEIIDKLKCESYIYDETNPHAVYDENPLVLQRFKEFLS